MSRFLLIIFFLPVTLLAQNWTSNSILDDTDLKTDLNFEIKIGANYSNITGYAGVEYKPLILPRVSFGYMLDMNNFIFNTNLTLNGQGYKSISELGNVQGNFHEIEYKFSSIFLNLDFLLQYKIVNNFFIVGGAYINSNIADKYSYKDNGPTIYEEKGEYQFDYAFSNVNYGLIIACSIDLYSNLSSSIGFEREIGNIIIDNYYIGNLNNNNNTYLRPYNIFLTFGYKI